MNNALITGTSSGIGYALTKALLARSYRVFGSVRKEEDADRLQQELGSWFVPLLFDVLDEGTLQDAAHTVAKHVGEAGLQVLINNAGIATTGPLLHLPLKELRQQLAVNVTGVVAVTQAFGPLLGARPDCPHPPGRIYNVGSIAATLSMPFSGPYGASKRALASLTDSLRMELMPFGIEVVLLTPGMVATSTRQDLAPERYTATTYAASITQAQTFIARQVQQGFQPDDFAARVATVIGRHQGPWEIALVKNKLLNWTIPRLLPQRFVAWAVGRVLRL